MANEKRLIYADVAKSVMEDCELWETEGELETAKTCIDLTPTVDTVEAVHAKWGEVGVADYKCSRCGFRFTSADPISMFQYCRCYL